LSSKEEKIAKQSFGSTFIVASGNIVYGIILAVCSLVVARLLGPAAYGVYGLALAIPLFLQFLVGVGVGPAITRFSAYYISQGNLATAQRMTKNAILFSIMTGLGLTVLSLVFSSTMSSIFFHRPLLTEYVEIASLSIIAQALFSFLTSAFIAWGIPVQDAIWNVIQAILKLSVSVFLILAGFGILGALWGFDISYFFAGFFGVIALYVLKLRKHMDEKTALLNWNVREFASDINRMVRYGLPDYIGYIILLFSQQPVLIIILSVITSNTIIGYYSAATNIASGLTLIVGSLTPVFFASFASLDGMGSDTSAAFSYAVKYISYFIMPTILFLIASSNFAIEIIYGTAYLSSSYYLELLMIANLPLAFGQAVLVSLFNGVGRTRLTLYLSVVEALATLAPAFVLIFLFNLGVNGLLYSIIISNFAPTAFGLYIASRYLGAKVDYTNLIKIFLVSMVSFGVIFLTSSFVFTNVSGLLFSLGAFVVELFVFLGLYLTLVPLFRAVGSQDIARLKMASHGLKVLSRLLYPILDYESFIVHHVERGTGQ
jgi:O-antigen/teichoic acid export membrane protein